VKEVLEMANINLNNLSNEITKHLETYTEDVRKKVDKATNKVTKEGVQLLKDVPIELTGDYRAGWARKKEGSGLIIHNRTDYQLTHLLEYGHAKTGGSRVAARPHIRPVEEKIVADFEELVKKAIQS